MTVNFPTVGQLKEYLVLTYADNDPQRRNTVVTTTQTKLEGRSNSHKESAWSKKNEIRCFKHWSYNITVHLGCMMQKIVNLRDSYGVKKCKLKSQGGMLCWAINPRNLCMCFPKKRFLVLFWNMLGLNLLRVKVQICTIYQESWSFFDSNYIFYYIWKTSTVERW